MKWVGAFLFFSFASDAHAFHIPDHMMITDRAIQGLDACGFLPEGWGLRWGKVIAAANAQEDLNVVRKAGYAHFYHPEHPLDLKWRVDSSVTLKESLAQIASVAPTANRGRAYPLLGRIVHHLQDSAVPAHVVPVFHFVHDGFEETDVSGFAAAPFSVEDCQALELVEPMNLLRQTARATLSAVDQPFAYREAGVISNSTWGNAFWNSGVGIAFGNYGPFGNNFGQAWIAQEGGSLLEVDPNQYVQFKKRQLDLAVKATQEMLLWGVRMLGL